MAELCLPTHSLSRQRRRSMKMVQRSAYPIHLSAVDRRHDHRVMPDLPTVRCQVDGAVTIVTIDRPAARNAVNPPTAAALADAFRRFDGDASQHGAILTRAEGTFCAGYDLKQTAAGHRGHRLESGDGTMGPTLVPGERPLLYGRALSLRSAACGRRASSCARRSDPASARPGSTSRLASPIRSASAPDTPRPVRIMSIARLWPISRGSRGSRMVPRSRRSHHNASSRPSATAWPSTAAGGGARGHLRCTAGASAGHPERIPPGHRHGCGHDRRLCCTKATGGHD